MNRRLPVACLLAAALAGCAGDGDGDGADPGQVDRTGRAATIGQADANLLRSRAQAGDGRQVVVDEVVLERKGWLAIHADGGGGPGPVIGVSGPLEPGRHTDLAVRLDRKLDKGLAKVWPALHAEDNGNETFDYPVADAPVVLGGGEAVLLPVDVTVD